MKRNSINNHNPKKDTHMRSCNSAEFVKNL